MTEFRHDQVTVDGTPIHTVTAGPTDAPALLLLHGWPESWATWRELIPLAAQAHRVVAIDLPGIGGSRGRGAPAAKAEIARLVHRLAGLLGLGDITLVGHDIGGMVAYAYRAARRHAPAVPAGRSRARRPGQRLRRRPPPGRGNERKDRRHRGRRPLPAPGRPREELAGHLRFHSGARKGRLFAYVHDPDGVTLELIQLAPSQPAEPGGTS